MEIMMTHIMELKIIPMHRMVPTMVHTLLMPVHMEHNTPHMQHTSHTTTIIMPILHTTMAIMGFTMDMAMDTIMDYTGMDMGTMVLHIIKQYRKLINESQNVQLSSRTSDYV